MKILKNAANSLIYAILIYGRWEGGGGVTKMLI